MGDSSSNSNCSFIAMEQSELVQMLRSRARKSGTHTSNYRGVSLLRHTQKWHAQINVNGRQVHLGFYESEELAARAYDRAAINKGAREHSRIITNFDINDYANEISILAAMEQTELVDILAVEQCGTLLSLRICYVTARFDHHTSVRLVARPAH